MPYIDMNQPWIYMCSPSWTSLPPPSPFYPSGSSQCTSPSTCLIHQTWTGDLLHNCLQSFPASGSFQTSQLFTSRGQSVYLRLLMFFLAILIPTCNSSSPTFCMIYSTYKLNKQGDNTQPWHTPFPVWNQSVVPCSVLTVDSWPLYTFLRRQVRWSGIPMSFRIFHSLLWPTQSKVLAESIKHLPSI